MPGRRLLTPYVALALAATVACGASSTEPKFGEAVAVKLGASVRIPNDTTTVRFSDVTADSRCPQGAPCVWAGDAAVVFTVGGSWASTLHTSSVGGPTTLLTNGKRLTLVSLAPVPKVGESIAKESYVATIRFDAALD
ncbi:MAG: hypothetical protein ACYC3L_11580 [Gemmatimonadaceae bacterium]